jgi:signal transduction histidine kinase
MSGRREIPRHLGADDLLDDSHATYFYDDAVPGGSVAGRSVAGGVPPVGARIAADAIDNASLVSAVVAVADGLDLDETLQRIVSTAASLMEARYGALGVLDSRGKVSRFVYVGMEPTAADRIGPLPDGHGILGLLPPEGAAIRLANLTEHPAAAGFPAGHPPMRSFLGVPIRIRGRVYGNLYLADKKRGHFSTADEQLLVALAAAAGVAIRNAGLFARSRRRQRWQQAVTAVDALVLAGFDTTLVAGEVTRWACDLASAAVAALGLPDDQGELRWASVVAAGSNGDATHQRWSVVQSRLPEDALARLTRIAGETGGLVPSEHPAKEAYSTGKAVSHGGPFDAPAADGVMSEGDQQVAADHLLGPMLVLPLRARAEVLGVLVLHRFAGDDAFNAEVLDLAESFCEQTAVALSFGAERRERERLAVFEERDRIARDLHDLVIQRLFATGMMLEGAARVDAIPPLLADRIGAAVDELDGTIKEIRTTIFDLHDVPDGPSWVGVRARVLAEVERASTGERPKPTVTFAGPVDTLADAAQAGQLIAALREGLSNAVRHSNGKGIAVHVSATDGVLAMRVRDDGEGVPKGGPGRLSGLANLTSRARDLGGDCVLSNRSERRGAELRWWIPLDGEFR